MSPRLRIGAVRIGREAKDATDIRAGVEETGFGRVEGDTGDEAASFDRDVSPRVSFDGRSVANVRPVVGTRPASGHRSAYYNERNTAASGYCGAARGS